MNPTRRGPADAALLLLVSAVVALFALPLVGLALRAPWGELAARLQSETVREALWLSAWCATAATACSLVLGLPVAVWLAAGAGPVRSAVRVLVTLPMVLPPVVGGIALLVAFGRNGIVGAWLLQWFGIALPFTSAGVVLAATWVAMPFFVLTAEAGLRSFDRRFADAASTLGAGRWRTFRTVTLPLVLPSLRAGLVVAWARALGEFGATITFAGNLQGRTQTLPLAVFIALESDRDAAVAMSLVLVAVSLVVLVALRDRWWGR